MRSMWKLDSTSAVREYPCPNDIVKIEQAYFRQSASHHYYPLDYKEWDSWDERPDTTNFVGTPSSISLRRDNMLVLSGLPSVNGTNSILLEGSQVALEMTADTHEVFRPKNVADHSSPYLGRHWEALVYYVLWKANEKDKDFQAAAYGQAQWMNEIQKIERTVDNRIDVKRVQRPFGSIRKRSWPSIDRTKSYP